MHLIIKETLMCRYKRTYQKKFCDGGSKSKVTDSHLLNQITSHVSLKKNRIKSDKKLFQLLSALSCLSGFIKQSPLFFLMTTRLQ